ncbi:hypothetical protein PTKIN_Ptkin12aG0207300 [Pterospermum kingtungense]
MHRNNSSNYAYTRFVGKLLFFTFFLVAIPLLIPSQAPDFINQTILNKFWELVHLTFIGIAVSYGLFGRRNVDDVVVNLDDSHESYVSAMFHVSSIFEDGFDHSMCYSSGQGKAGFFNAKNGSFENPCEENVVQAWNSKYFHGEPMVVLAQPNCCLEKYAESGSFIDYKPLGLPVRSLKSMVETRGSPEFGNESSESPSPGVNDSSDGSNYKSGSGRFSDLGSDNLEGKFRVRECVHGGHFRPLPVDETQFESLKSRSLRSTDSPSDSLSPSHSKSSESPNSSELVMESSPCSQSFPPTSPPVPKPISKGPVNASHSRQFSDGSLLGVRKCFEDALNEFCDGERDDSSSSGKEWISGSLKFDAKSSATSKASSRAKSVRTFRTFRARARASVSTRDAGEKLENHRKGKLTMGSDEIEEAYAGEIEPKIEEHNDLSIGLNRQNFGGDSYMTTPTSPKNQNREKQERSGNSAAESGQDLDRENEDSAAESGTFSLAGSEVDRKAGEFIAKFREQIRLQRTTSIETPKRLRHH